MKYAFYCLIIVTIITSCTKIEENNDPIIGIWRNETEVVSNKNDLNIDKEEWIFNDAYLGRFHGFSNGSIIFKTDFRWSIENDVYVIIYLGTDFPDEYVKMNSNEEGTYLETKEGNERAKRIN